ncbi:PREDICTED: uncharacterized protein LOC108547181 [Eufriesea mexicana]|uniref:uncharacterized protein LOC108547181 n=1 Tax=Eufriesea mexicana TaxID=516756 RepID=UPI00083BE00D|nr:PREDICTED: uncharacterized protein LOC108547181 [Eufriesea mexicana]
MSSLGMYELTHPESLSESQLKEILENRCIDFSDYKHFSKSDLIELYKRVALPLPQRQSENIQNFDTKGYNEEIYSTNEFHRKLVLLTSTCSTKASLNETIKTPATSSVRSKSSINEFKQTSKKIRLCNSNNVLKYNGIDKRISDEKHDGASPKKKQKITWP